MENANPSCSTSNREFLDPKKKREIESWLEDNRIIDSLDGSDEIEYFDAFPTLEELEYHEWLLIYPKPSWVKAKIRTENLNNVKISCNMGHFLKRHAYIDLESPNNVMSKQHYNGIMNKGLELRQKPSNPSRKAHLLEDKQIPSVGVFDEVSFYTLFRALGWHLEEIHMTWAHLDKKRMRLWSCTKIHQEVLFSERGDDVAGIKRRRRDISGDSVWILATASQSIEQFLSNFANHLNETNMNDLESDDESVDTPLVSPFPHSDNDSDDGEVLNELIEYENVRMLRREKAINSFDGDDLAFQCRKAHLLEDKQISSVGVLALGRAFGGNTTLNWAHLRRRYGRDLRTCTKNYTKKYYSQSRRRRRRR
ncbi:hypothetical protein Tco_0849370 [Tanacetum coccineum]